MPASSGCSQSASGRLDDLRRFVAEHPGDRRALVGDPEIPVDDGDDVAGVLGQGAEPGLGAGDVLEDGAGQGGDELGQLDLVLAEQALDVAVGGVEAGDGLAVAVDRRAQRRPQPREHDAVGRVDVATVGQHHRASGLDGPHDQAVAQPVDAPTRAGAGPGQPPRGVVELDDVALVAPQQRHRRLPHGGVHGGRIGSGGDAPAHADERGEPVGQRQVRRGRTDRSVTRSGTSSGAGRAVRPPVAGGDQVGDVGLGPGQHLVGCQPVECQPVDCQPFERQPPSARPARPKAWRVRACS